MRVLITGASGFLGGHLAEGALRAGHEVRVLVRESSDLTHLRTLSGAGSGVSGAGSGVSGAGSGVSGAGSGVEFAYGDLTDADALARAAEGVDVVHHSAARVVEYGTRRQFWTANVLGTRLLMDAARGAGAGRFVFISSPSALMEVGEGDRFGVDESAPYPSRYYNLYSETKAAAERLVLSANRPDFTTLSLRPRGVWGERDHAGFLPRLVTRMAAGRLPDLPGDRTVLASLCHCDNAVAAALLAAEAPAGRVGGRAYFVADREHTDIGALLRRLAALFGVRPPSRRIPPPVRDGLVEAVELLWRLPALAARYEPPLTRYAVALLTHSTTYDTAAAERDFGYAPVIGQEEGLRRLMAWAEPLGGAAYFRRRLG
ncbi:NAD-dependent epimerase/dehydratase family protein [Streptomyces sp. NPDC093085]|uniref:NAD-dependent epimerase/dehydratase family protein n=1 Tax=Streptomyces sp. NPDC093085 TaxID=3155068 RepID=UPI003444AE11